jgi:DNA-directed RNA polymerase specialized sigma24 family protein
VGLNELLVRAVESARPLASPEDGVFHRDLVEAITALPPAERRALVLCKIMGYEAESEDRGKMTAATICGVSGRTIRTRLNKAIVKLSQFKEEAWS